MIKFPFGAVIDFKKTYMSPQKAATTGFSSLNESRSPHVSGDMSPVSKISTNYCKLHTYSGFAELANVNYDD